MARGVPRTPLGWALRTLWSSQGEGPSLSTAWKQPIPPDFPERALGELNTPPCACSPRGTVPATSWPSFFPGALPHPISPLPEAPCHPGLSCGEELSEGHGQGHCHQGGCASVGRGRRPSCRALTGPPLGRPPMSWGGSSQAALRPSLSTGGETGAQTQGVELRAKSSALVPASSAPWPLWRFLPWTHYR